MAEEATGFSPDPNEDRAEQEQAEKALEDRINAIVNRAISARGKSQDKKLDAIAQQLAALASPQSEEPKAEAKRADDPRLQKMQAEMEKLNARNQRSREMTLQASVRDALIASNILPEQAEKLVPYYRQFAAYESDDSDNLIFRTDDGDPMDLRAGIQTHVKSDPSLKSFTAPKGVNGSGDRDYRAARTTDPAKRFNDFVSK